MGEGKGSVQLHCGIADSRSVGVVMRASVNLVWIVSGAGPLWSQPHTGSASGAS